jgi:phage terminase small subunit
LGNELGLTPVARARIRVSDAKPDEDEVDKVMKIAG